MYVKVVSGRRLDTSGRVTAPNQPMFHANPWDRAAHVE